MWKKGINIPSCGILGFPGGSDSEESACNSGDLCSIPGSGRSPGEGNGHPLQYSRLENSMDRRPWAVEAGGRGVVEGVVWRKKLDKTEQLTP